MTRPETKAFQQTVLSYYKAHGRHDMPWRQPKTNGNFDPYKILVSEAMLQQTQVSRVIPKFEEFIREFPTVQALASRPLGDVLIAWNGLGYNRRAKFLWQAAQRIVSEHKESVPVNELELVRLPGVGKNTAGAILAYAFNVPSVFIETNIRTVYIYHFFYDVQSVDDKIISEKLMQTLDHTNPRQFYWALMDYGSYLKQTVGNLNKLSKSYATQSRFQGSLRQIRGAVIRQLTSSPLTLAKLRTTIADDRLDAVVDTLVKEGLIAKRGVRYHLA